MVGLGFPPKPYLQNANECMNSVLKSARSQKCKSISEVAEKLRTVVKKQENLQKICNRRQILPDQHEKTRKIFEKI